MLPRFNELKLLAAAIKHKLGTESYDCNRQGHYIPPEMISKKIQERNFRFIADCWHCRKMVFFDCRIDSEGKLVVDKKEYNGKADLSDYFAGINANRYHEPHEAPHEHDGRLVIDRTVCKVCGGSAANLPLCQGHTLQALLEMKFTEVASLDELVASMKMGLPVLSGESQARQLEVLRVMLNRLQGSELSDFIMGLPHVIRKLKVC